MQDDVRNRKLQEDNTMGINQSYNSSMRTQSIGPNKFTSHFRRRDNTLSPADESMPFILNHRSNIKRNAMTRINNTAAAGSLRIKKPT